jgi:hypothetical protein
MIEFGGNVPEPVVVPAVVEVVLVVEVVAVVEVVEVVLVVAVVLVVDVVLVVAVVVAEVLVVLVVLVAVPVAVAVPVEPPPPPPPHPIKMALPTTIASPRIEYPLFLIIENLKGVGVLYCIFVAERRLDPTFGARVLTAQPQFRFITFQPPVTVEPAVVLVVVFFPEVPLPPFDAAPVPPVSDQQPPPHPMSTKQISTKKTPIEVFFRVSMCLS